jgi:peptidylprolyl isomerase
VSRISALLLTAVLLLLAGCGGGDGKKDAKAGPFTFPTVSTDKVGEEPVIVSSTEPPTTTQLKVLHEGTGKQVGKDDVIVTDLKGQVWDKGGVDLPPFVNSFKSGDLLIRPIDQVVPAWTKVLPGLKVGSRVLMVVPPADGFGNQGNSGADIFPTDTIMFVIDILDTWSPGTMANGKAVRVTPDAGLPSVTSGKAPKVTVPKVDPPKDLAKRLLLQGSGATIEAGQTVVVQYVGVLWRTGKPFDSSWEPGRHPFAARLVVTNAETGEQGIIEGWVKGLAGQKVGSRVLLVVPPKLGYGASGNEDAGIKGTDTLVFVIDVLGAYGHAATR